MAESCAVRHFSYRITPPPPPIGANTSAGGGGGDGGGDGGIVSVQTEERDGCVR